MTASTPATPLSKIKKRDTPLCSTPGGGSKVREEKILVTVRVRPLSPREVAAYDLIAWDFADENTIVSRNLSHEQRHTGPYTFDKVFDPTCMTQKVYEEGAREVALSALNGINATIFAYGQTSSGKTFTMRGITESAVKDIYDHIKNSMDSEFVLKLSALEIYNETVVDLLNRESGCLRLLDDPVKGTIVEKLTEEVVRDDQHLRHLIGTCEAQRQVGETSLNDKSSRSHQIIRLMIESRLGENSGCVRSFLASLSFVDLAGSERVSQTNADGTRLKEGSHINRSLLTLTTVIRKLSCGKKSGHIPYRDSKLTRILQASLGGNARTAIICTMSPALSHVEHSRNTLLFATSAKEVKNTARVNMVVAEKQLLKYLEKEVTRLRAEQRSPEPSSSLCLRSLLMEKEQKIQQMEREMNELKRQRDLAQSQLELERSQKEIKGSNQFGPSHQVAKCLSFSMENDRVSGRPLSETLTRKGQGRQTIVRQSAASTDPSMLVHEIRKLEMRQKQLGEEANRALELLHKEVSSHRLGGQDASETIAKLLSEIKEMHAISCSIPEEIEIKDKASLKEEITRLNSQGSNIAALEEKLENVQKSIDKLVMYFPIGEEFSDFKTPSKKKKILPFTLSNTSNMPNLIRSPCSPLSSSRNEIENRAPSDCGTDIISGSNAHHRHKEATPKNYEDRNCISSREATPASKQPNSVNVKKMQKMFKTAAEENIRSIKTYVTELKERVAKLQYQKQLLVCQVLEMEANEGVSDISDMGNPSPASWHLVFEDQRKQIIMLWHLCHVSIIHRTQFYMLFRGDPADQIYMEVELRRLTWLERHLAELGNASPALLGDEPASSVSSSIKALKQEREYLAKRVSTKLSAEILESCGLNYDGYYFWISLGALFGFTMFFNIGFTLALTFLKPPGSRAIISNERLSQIQGSKGSKDDTNVEKKSISSSDQTITERKKGRMVLPFQPLTVVFQDLQYSIDNPLEMRDCGFNQKTLQLLSDIMGAFRPGVLTALMGVSRAGKATLLDVLSGRKTSGIIEGDIKIGGYPKVQDTFARISGYCEQSDVHSPQSTGEESVIFSAWHRLHPQIDSKTKTDFVKEVLETIELDGIKDALVGVPGITGLSSEQRKRLTIAVELVANPSIIFMDEPTTGFDARKAAIVMRAVKNVVDTGRTIVCTIHQPSIDIFESFDKLILLKIGGHMIYCGPLGQHSNSIIEYFEGISGVPKIRNNYSGS